MWYVVTLKYINLLSNLFNEGRTDENGEDNSQYSQN